MRSEIRPLLSSSLYAQSQKNEMKYWNLNNIYPNKSNLSGVLLQKRAREEGTRHARFTASLKLQYGQPIRAFSVC